MESLDESLNEPLIESLTEEIHELQQHLLYSRTLAKEDYDEIKFLIDIHPAFKNFSNTSDPAFMAYRMRVHTTFLLICIAPNHDDVLDDHYNWSDTS